MFMLSSPRVPTKNRIRSTKRSHQGRFFATSRRYLPLPLSLSNPKRVGLQEMRPKESIVTVSLSLSVPLYQKEEGRKLHNVPPPPRRRPHTDYVVQCLLESMMHVTMPEGRSQNTNVKLLKLM